MKQSVLIHMAKRSRAQRAGEGVGFRGGAWLARNLLPNAGTIVIVLILIFTQNAWAHPLAAPYAAGPATMSFTVQGRLANPDGTAVADGAYNLSFAIYDAASGGNLVWGPESHSAVPVRGGLYSVGVGSKTGGGIPTSVWDGDRYLEIGVNGETLSPRELVRSVPMADWARSAEVANTVLTLPAASVTTDTIQDAAVTGDKIAKGAVGEDTLAADVHIPVIKSGVVEINSNTPTPVSSYRDRLNQGSGRRTTDPIHVSFDEPFVTAPVVVASFTLLDCGAVDYTKPTNTRIEVITTGITPDGFDLVIATWADSKVWSANVAWVAYTQ